ncbi:GNAT family protein [Rapidithrix thailandica]|uniref:GNAT family protein n=1 Tax=Rapidithrix thailandica TaxID=413964 RepID=A0AAW9SEN9_9BACT
MILQITLDLRLRPLCFEDHREMARLANNRKIWRNLRDLFPSPYTEEDAKEFIAIYQGERMPPTFAIEYQGNFAGVVGLVPQSDVYKKTAEVGYWLGEPYWGKGIMTQVVKQIVRYGFEQLGFLRIFTGVFAYNLASQHVLEKAGFVKEAVFKNAIFKDGQVTDEVRYGIWKESDISE